MKKILISCTILIISALVLLFIGSSSTDEQIVVEEQFQKEIDKVSTFIDNPETSTFLDFNEIATQFQENIYNSTNAAFSAKGYNVDAEEIPMLMSYVGGKQSAEAITNISAQISAEMIGLESNEEVVLEFFNSTNEQGVALNNVNTTSGQTYWYEVFPNILFLWYYDVTGNVELEDEANSIYEQFLELVNTLSYETENINFDKSTGYNYKSDEAVNNEKWVEPDAAVGVALIMDYAYEDTKNEEYKQAAIKCLDYINQLDYNPKYELLSAFGAALCAKYNALYGTNYDVSKMLMWEFDTTSDIREGWGMLSGEYGEADVDAMVGSVNDFGGYGFSMNTFVEAIALAPLAKYDASYQDAIGKYLYNAYASLAYFYAGTQSSSNYTQPGVYPEEAYVPYEGFKHSFNGEEGYASGDPTEYGWAKSDLSIYGGSYAGIFASLIHETNVENVFMFDLNSTDFFTSNEVENYLIYNPYDYEITVQIETELLIYNIDENKVVEEVVIQPGESVQVALIEDENKINIQDNIVYYDDILLSVKTNTVEITNIKQNEVTNSTFKIETVTNLTNIDTMNIYLDDTLVYSGEYLTSYEFTNQQNFSGQYYLTFELISGDEIIYDTVSIEIGSTTSSNTYEYTETSEFTSIDVMAGTMTNGVVTETNEDGMWGGVSSEVIYLDPNQSYNLTINVSDVTTSWALQLHVLNDPLNEYGYYIQGDTASTGDFTYNLDSLISQLPTNADGLVECQIWLVASGSEGASFTVNSLSVNQQQVISNTYTEPIIYDATDITNMLINQPYVYYDYSEGIIGLQNNNYTAAYNFMTPSYVANENSTFVFEFSGVGEVKLEVVNYTTGEITEIPSGEVNLTEYGVTAGDVFSIKISVNSGIGDTIYINKMELK